MSDPGAIPPAPPMVVPYASPFPGGAPALSSQQLAELAAARKLAAGLRRAVTIAKIDGWTTGIFGLITLVGSIGSIPGMLLGAGMTTIAFFQLRSAERLRRQDEKAPGALARHQITLGSLLFLYGAFSLGMVLYSPVSLSQSAAEVDPSLAELLAPYDNLAQAAFVAVYATVMLVAITIPGLTATYYYSQRKRLIAYRAATPEWILALQSAGVAI